MQLSVKTSPELTLPLLEKCAVLAERYPSYFVTNIVWQCVKCMNLPHHDPFHPLDIVQTYYREAGKEGQLLFHNRKERDTLIEGLIERDQQKRAKEAARRLAEFRASLHKEPPPKHLHLKISQGIDDLPLRIKAKAEWLRMSPNALVMACLRDVFAAMDNLAQAVVPPPIVVQFWSVSHAKERRRAKDAIDAMIMRNLDGTLRQRSGPILDTIVRFAVSEQWDVTLRQILRDADALPNEWMPKD